MPFGTGYRSGRGIGAGAFSPPRTNQGTPMQPVPMTGQSGQPQTAKWSVADAIMSQTYGDEIAKDDWAEELSGEEDDDDMADYEEWNTPRYDVERFHQAESFSHVRAREGQLSRAETARARYLREMRRIDENALRAFIRQTLIEINAISLGGGSVEARGNIRGGGAKPLGTGTTKSSKSKKRGKKKQDRNAESFGGGHYVD